MPINTILVSTDFSDSSAVALKRAAELAVAFDAKLHVVHVVEKAPVFLAVRLEESEHGITPFEEHFVTEAKKKLAACVGELPEEDRVDVERHFRAGFPPIEILECAKEVEPDLLVMATHGRHGFSRAFLGSVAEKVVRTASCPVLTCKLHDEAEALESFRPQRILYPIDLADEQFDGLDLAIEMARKFGAELHVVYVIADFDSGMSWDDVPLAPPGGDDIIDKWEKHCRENLDATVKKHLPEDISHESHLRKGRPHKGILEYAKDHDCGLIVMPTHGRSGLSHALLGSVTERVVRLAEAPVLTVRGSH